MQGNVNNVNATVYCMHLLQFYSKDPFLHMPIAMLSFSMKFLRPTGTGFAPIGKDLNVAHTNIGVLL